MATSNIPTSLSASDMYSSIYKICDKVDTNSCFVSAQAQIDYVLTNYISLERWYRESFAPVLESSQSKAFKSLDDAKRFKDFAELYKNMAEPRFIDKAFESLNNAILYAPFEERNFLFDCFAQRSNLHYHRDDYESALADINHALHFRYSYTCTERKVSILKKLNRGNEAYQFVTESLNSPDISAKLTDRKRDLLKKLKKDLKQWKSSSVETEKDKNLDKSKTEQVEGSFYYLEVDPRAKLTMNKAQRYIFKAQADIPANTSILSEDPLSLMFRHSSVQRFCLFCYKKSHNNFWPCANCNEVVFCSPKCAQQASNHKYECGLIGVFQNTLCSQATQVFRNLVSIGHLNINKLEEEAKSFALEETLTELTSKHVKKSTIEKWFNLNQTKMLERIYTKKQTRSASELSNAIFIFVAYCFKMNIKISELDTKMVADLIRILSITILKVVLNEYGWHEVNDNQERVQVANFQCLFGSLIGHNCEPNAEWSFNGKHFNIRSIKPILEGDEIAITYGLSKDNNLLKRQKHLQNFYVMCSCSKCMKEAKQTFSIRCENCQGPIPFDMNEFPNETCMVCEQNYDNGSIMKSIQREMDSAKRSIWLIKQIDNDEHIKHIENMMSTLACYVYLHNEPFLNLVRDLCDEYIQRGLFKPAVEWYQWFVDGSEIYLSSNADPLTHFYNLNQWAHAYTKFIEQQASEGKVVGNNYIETGSQIFKRLFLILELLSNKPASLDLALFDCLHFQQLIKSFYSNAHDKSYRYNEICEQIQNSSRIVDKKKETQQEKNSLDSRSSSISLQTVN